MTSRSNLLSSVLKKKILSVVVISITTTLFAAFLKYTGHLRDIESRTWDMRLRVVADESKADPNIAIVVIDQSSLTRFAADDVVWPWPRELYGYVIQYLKHAGAKGVAFDVLFTEESRMGVEDDKRFAEAIDANFPVILATPVGIGKVTDEREQIFVSKQRASDSKSRFGKRYLGQNALRYDHATFPIVELMNRPSSLGNVHIDPDSDGVFRHYRPGVFYNDVPVLSLPFALYDAVDDSTRANSSHFKMAIDDQGLLSISPHGGESVYEKFSMYDIIRSELALRHPEMLAAPEKPSIDPSRLKGKWVFVGATAPGLFDVHPTVLAEKASGVTYNAAVLDNLLHNDFVRKLPDSANVVLVFTLALLAGLLSMFANSIRMQAFSLIILISGFVLLTFVLAKAGVWVAFAIPVLSFLLSSLLAFACHYQIEGREHRFIRNAFKHYLSATVIEQLTANPDLLSLGGERKEVTVLFSDIAGFTAISEKLDPQQLVALLNDYLTAMTDIILDYEGTLDKYIGDAILCFWNAPVATADHASRAIRAALRCKAKLKEVSEQFERLYQIQVKARIGVTTGVAVVGNFGSAKRFDYTVVGDTVNLASRLEGANKYFKTEILFSGELESQLDKNILRRRLADVQVVGKAKAVSIFEPYNPADYSVEVLETFAKARDEFDSGRLSTALARFESIKDSDPASKVYIDRIQHELREHGGDPKGVWSPVWKLSEK